MVSKSEKKGLYVAGAAIIIFLLAAQMGYLATYGIKPFFSSTPQGPTNTQTTKDDYYNGIGKFQLDCKSWDTCDNTVTHVIGAASDLTIQWYHFTGSWVPETTYDPAAAPANYFDAKATDNGYAWISVKIPAGKAFYIDYALTKSSDPYIVGYQYVDVDSDQKKEFVFQYDLKNHAVPNSGYPIISFTAYLMTEDAAPTGWMIATNVTGAGHATMTAYADNYIAFSGEKTGDALYKYQIKLNTTDITKAKLVSCMIPGLGTIDGSAFTQDITDSYITWTYTITNNFNGADYVMRQVGSNNKFYFTQQWTLLPAAGETLAFANNLYYLLAQTEAGATMTGTNGWGLRGS